MVAIPVGIPQDAVIKLSKTCPIKIELDFDEETED